MSKSSVTAGLIGGRVGNKGGVGISLNLNGTTLLFLNAHLAGMYTSFVRISFTEHMPLAHEGKVQHRLANLAKIKVSADTQRLWRYGLTLRVLGRTECRHVLIS